MCARSTECRHPNYVTKNGKILAVDPKDATETEIKIKGVAWSGMEKLSMIPDGLWGTEAPNQGVQATTVVRISSRTLALVHVNGSALVNDLLRARIRCHALALLLV